MSDARQQPSGEFVRAGSEPGATMRVSVCQLGSTVDSATNRAQVSAAIAGAAAQRPDLVVLPEASMHDFGGPTTDLGSVAETLDGPFVDALRSAASAARAVVVAGMFERRADGGSRPHNTVVAVGPDGAILARYRKLHVYDAFSFRESDRITPGSEHPPVFRVGALQVGVMTCYDVRFPETGRLLADAGADVMLVPAAWVPGAQKVAHWTTLLAARAIENTAYVVGAAQPGPRYCGHSAIIDPAGMSLSTADAEPGSIWADLSAEAVAAARRTNPSLVNRRFTVVPRAQG